MFLVDMLYVVPTAFVPTSIPCDSYVYATH